MPLSSFAGPRETAYESRMVLRRIVIYPIKSLDGGERAAARITAAGSLEHDRAWAIFNAEGRVVNGKRSACIHALRSISAEDLRAVRLGIEGEAETFVLVEPEPIGAWLSKFLGFRGGEVACFGHNPCQRCVVPTRDPDTGTVTLNFQRRFMEARRDGLPEWAHRECFNHFYRLAVNTSIPPTEAGKTLRIGDPVELVPWP